jgi:hypothetical protein
MVVAKELAEYKLDVVEYKKSYGTKMAQNQQVNTHFSMEMGMKIMN